MEAKPARVLGPKDGKAGFLGSIGARLMIDGLESGGGRISRVGVLDWASVPECHPTVAVTRLASSRCLAPTVRAPKPGSPGSD